MIILGLADLFSVRKDDIFFISGSDFSSGFISASFCTTFENCLPKMPETLFFKELRMDLSILP